MLLILPMPQEYPFPYPYLEITSVPGDNPCTTLRFVDITILYFSRYPDGMDHFPTGAGYREPGWMGFIHVREIAIYLHSC